MLGRHGVRNLHVLGHGVFLGAGAFEAVPRVPLGLALEVEHARPVGVAVADGGLLVVLVQVKQLLVAQGLVDLVVHRVHRSFKLGIHVDPIRAAFPLVI